MARKKKAAGAAPRVHHPRDCRGGCGGSGILSGGNAPIKQPNGEVTWKNGARCPGTLLQTPATDPAAGGTLPAAGETKPPVRETVDGQALAAGERRDGR